MNFSQTALSWIGVSSPEIEKLIELIQSTGESIGAKLTGAGGGGSVIALPVPGKAESVAREISKGYPVCFLTDAQQEGLRFEK
jgi:mevalonate kinase